MANSLLTPTAVTRESLRVLHQKLTFVGNVTRDYDDSFAKSGAKVGDTLKIRLPNQYVVRSGATLSAQDTTETSVSLQVATQKGVDLNFTSADLTLSLDDFSKRIIDPAMSVLAASIEADAYSMYKDVYQMVDNDASAVTFKNILQGRQALQNSLAPANDRCAILSTGHNVTLVDALKGLYNDPTTLSKQYREGMMGHTGGFDFYESTHASDHTTGTAAKTTGYTVNGASQTGNYVTIQTGTTSFFKGDIITFAGCYAVHPETKASTGALQQFVVTNSLATGYCGNGTGASATSTGTSTTQVGISPAIVTSGATQNVSASPTNAGAVVKVGAGASETLNTSMVFQPGAFAFATADLVMPQGVDFSAREVFDGISMRIVRQYDITNDKFPCRLDVLYGYKTLRPQLACRIHADG